METSPKGSPNRAQKFRQFGILGSLAPPILQQPRPKERTHKTRAPPIPPTAGFDEKVSCNTSNESLNESQNLDKLVFDNPWSHQSPKVSLMGPPTTRTGGVLEGTELMFEVPEIRFHNRATTVSDTSHSGDLKCPRWDIERKRGSFWRPRLHIWLMDAQALRQSR